MSKVAFKLLKDYANTIEAKIIAEGFDKVDLETPILILSKKRGQYHLDIIEIRWEEGHIRYKYISTLYLGDK